MTCVKPVCGIGAIAGCDPTCDCGPDLCNLPNPYVVNADASQECHCTTVIQQLYVTGLSLKAAIVVPSCEGYVVAAITGIHSIIIGSYLWNPSYGHFKVTGFDYATEQVTLQNECQTGNASVGSTIPACTLFLVVDEPCCDDGVGGVLYYPYLAVDFTAPAVGACLDITVTSTVGLASDMSVQVGTGVYKINSIVSDTVINICNTLSAGATPGTVVTALDSSSVYITPILIVGVALCGGSSDTEGALVICADGQSTVLEGDTLGYVPVLTALSSNNVEFQNPIDVFGFDFCTWDLSARVQNDIVNYYASQAGGIIAVGSATTLNRMTTSPVLVENDTCVECNVILSFSGYSTGAFNSLTTGDWANVSIALSVGSDIDTIGLSSVLTGDIEATVYDEIAFNRIANPIYHTSRVEWLETYTIPAGEELQVGFSIAVTHNASNVGSYNTQDVIGEVKGYLLSI